METFTVGFGARTASSPARQKRRGNSAASTTRLELTASDLADKIERIAWHLDEPIGDPAAFAVLKVCELARSM